MGLKPIKSWDSEPKGWLEEPASNVEPKTEEVTAAEPETQTSELAGWNLNPSPEDLVEEATGGVATEDPVIGVDLAPDVPITETLDEVARNPINSEPVILAVPDPIDDNDAVGVNDNDAVEEDQDVLDLTFRIMQLYNLPYDLSRAFEMACSADSEDRTTTYEHIIKLLKHRLGALDVDTALTQAAIPMEDSADWIIDVLGLDFVYGKCVDSILTYAQTGKVSILQSAIRTLEYHVTMRKYDEPM